MLDSVAGQYPDRPFVITEQGTLNYAERPDGRRGWPAGRPPVVRPGDHRWDGQ
jgi:hypothetical protein